MARSRRRRSRTSPMNQRSRGSSPNSWRASYCLSSSRDSTTSRRGLRCSSAYAMNALPNDPVPPVSRMLAPSSKAIVTSGRSQRRRCAIMAPVRVNAVIQARLSSTRLPGKVLRPLAGRSVLSWVVRAAAHTAEIGTVIVATSVDAGDDAVAEEAVRAGAEVVRGPLDDVLARYELAAQTHPCDAVVRLTADCPLHDPSLIAQVAGVWLADPGLQYVSNVLVRTLPRGFDVELVRRDVLAEQYETATGAHREHVTSGIYTRPATY